MDSLPLSISHSAYLDARDAYIHLLKRDMIILNLTNLNRYE